jgi:hypothetical protein
VSRTLLTAVILFDKGKFLPNAFDHAKALSLSFDFLTTMIAMRTGAREFEAAQHTAQNRAVRASSSGSLHIPAMGDVTNPCRGFIQQAYHAQGSLLAIVELFYEDIKKHKKKEKKGPWDKLTERVTKRHGDSDSFVKFLGEAVPFLKGIQNIRDCLDHKNVKGVTLRDFVLHPNGQIIVPTIEVKFRGARQRPVPISQFMTDVLSYLMTVFELMIAHLCSSHYKPPAPIFPIYIDIPAENRRFWKHVRFYYGFCWNGEFIPIG